MFTVAAFYQFKDTPNYKDIRECFNDVCTQLGIKGTVLLAPEGINGTVAGTREAIFTFKELLIKNSFTNLEYKESFASEMPFFRLKVRLKKEIVTLGRKEVIPSCLVGTYVEPYDWNDLISSPDVITIDTRNYYEYTIGTFKGAINPKTKSFREFPGYISQNHTQNKTKKIAMFCTGGIRCEKSTSLLLSMGFREVYHLKGGILKYLELIPENVSLWQGECFVFDHRIAVTHGLKIGTYTKCHGCRMPLSQEDILSPYYEVGVTCHYCHTNQNASHYNRVRERQKQMIIARKHGRVHIGSKRDVYSNKGNHNLIHAT